MTLKKITPNIYEVRLPVVHVWRDDLKRMETLIREGLEVSDLKIHAHDSVDAYTLSDIDDLAAIPRPRIRLLTISADKFDFSMKLGAWPTLIRAEEPNLLARGMIAELVKILRSCDRARAFDWIFRHVKIWLVGTVLLLLLSVYSIASSPPQEDIVGFWPGLALALVPAILLMVPIFLWKPWSSIIFVKTRLEAPTFWSRKKDDILITILSNVASLILGGFIGYWINTMS